MLPPRSAVRNCQKENQYEKGDGIQRATKTYVAILNRAESSLLDDLSMSWQLHVAQHHDSGQQEGSRVGLVFPSDVRSSAVHLQDEFVSCSTSAAYEHGWMT